MNNNGHSINSAEVDTPFADITELQESKVHFKPSNNYPNSYIVETESPFLATYDFNMPSSELVLDGEDFTELLSELSDPEFTEALYDIADEVEDTWRTKVNNEIAMGSKFIPFAQQQAHDYFSPLILETEKMIDTVAAHFSGNDLADPTADEIESFFSELEVNHDHFTPIQEQFFGKIFKKVKKAVKKGVNIVKKGIKAVKKLLPINIILGKIKRLVRPLLNRVLRFALGKLPKNLRPYAQTLAKKFLRLETTEENTDEVLDSQNGLENIQTEFDNYLSQLVFSNNEEESENYVVDYETSIDNLERLNSYSNNHSNILSLQEARQILVADLKNLKPDESPAPAIERFLPAAIMALRPVIKMAIKIIGRQKIINFLAGLLANLVKKYVPAHVARPLSANIVDVGLKVIGFEVDESKEVDLAYEAIVNTIEDTIQKMPLEEDDELENTELIATNLLETFEESAADNFPSQYIKEELRSTKIKGVWVGMPRKLPKKYYKKFTHIFYINIAPKTASTIKIFRGLRLSNYLRDKYGLDITKPIKARVHLFETKVNGRLSHISRYEKLPGLNARQPRAWIQLLPLTKQAANLLLNEPSLGQKISHNSISTRHKTIAGQRYYYLEIEGAKLRLPQVKRTNYRVKGNRKARSVTESRSADIQGILNFNKSEIKLNYFFSEEDARAIASKLNKNDFIGASRKVSRSLKKVFGSILNGNIGSKVKIIHESFPEIYLDNGDHLEEQFFSFSKLGKIVGKDLISKITDKLIKMILRKANKSLLSFFKTRSLEFTNAQALPKDGVTLKLTWKNISGMNSLKTIIKAVKGNGSIGSLTNLAITNFPAPEIKVVADKDFE